MKMTFELAYKDDLTATPVQIMERNVRALETLCKRGNKENFQVELFSPEKYENPKNVFELSALIAEDLVMKYNENNVIVRAKN